jgi:tetratricopeptide (TPR) repeat protein
MAETGNVHPQQRPAGAPLQARFEQAVALHEQGHLAAAERIYRDILRQQPQHIGAMHLLGVIALRTGHSEQGAELIKKAVALNPNNAVAHCNLATAMVKLKRPAEALASCDQAIALKPDLAEAHYNRADILLNLKRPEEALASCDQAIALKPDLAEAHLNRGNALNDLERPAEALSSYDQAIALKPDYAAAFFNRGIALGRLRRLNDALASYDQAIALRPDDAEAYSNRGNVLKSLRRPAEAVASFDKAIALKPDYAHAYWNQSLCLMMLGRFEQGWRQFEWRKQSDKQFAARSFAQPLWRGQDDIGGKTLFIWWEQGIGDTIQFSRYARLAEARGAKVIMSVHHTLRGLLGQISPTIEIIGPDEAPAGFDYHCPLLSLPLAFGTTLATIPPPQPYLQADQALKATWAARLPAKTRSRIGLVWSGKADHTNDLNRSIELQHVLPMLSRDADWICLQKEIRANDLAVLRNSGRVAFFGDDLKNFSDTAALLDLMDLVVTVDTSVAHLAGAMGKPVWILLPFSPDWRWLLERDDSPWYPTARLFRQPEIGNWPAVVARVANELRSVID